MESRPRFLSLPKDNRKEGKGFIVLHDWSRVVERWSLTQTRNILLFVASLRGFHRRLKLRDITRCTGSRSGYRRVWK